MRSQRAEGEETAKNAKTSNLQYIPQKHIFFKVEKHRKLIKTSKSASKKGSSHKGDPAEVIFHDFASILELPGGPEMSPKLPKEESEKKVKKKVLSLKGPKLAPGQGRTQNLSNGLPI